MLDLFNKSNIEKLVNPINNTLSSLEIINQITILKKKLKEEVIILGHHYQQDDVIRFADLTGDSLKLAKEAEKLKKKYIVFCGVHFMAETTDILIDDSQSCILPDLQAGCSMADMAQRDTVEQAWKVINNSTTKKVIPITYINCEASLKSFVGENGGSICTSSNASKVIQWAFTKGEKLLFFPDQHLGRNTCFELGISLTDMVIYSPNKVNGGLTKEQIDKAKVILWDGFCSVHQGFTATQVSDAKEKYPDSTIIVHPECSFEVVNNADLSGSTSFIINTIKNAKDGSRFFVGTEINLVNRLAKTYPNKKIQSLSPYQCLCVTMYRVSPEWLLYSLQCIDAGKPINIIKVDKKTSKFAKIALETMLSL